MVLMSKMDFSVNCSPFKTIVSRKVISFSDISAVNIWPIKLSSLKSEVDKLKVEVLFWYPWIKAFLIRVVGDFLLENLFTMTLILLL